MGLLERYFLHIKRPVPADFNAVAENLRQIEHWANILPLPAPQMFAITDDAVPFTLASMETYIFYTARPNTIITVDLAVEVRRATAGGGSAIFYAYIDGVAIDTDNFAAMNEAAIRVVSSTCYTATIPQAGRHTLELWAEKTINAGVFNYGGNIRLAVF